MKNLIYWFIGDRTGRIIVSLWNWLWGVPLESGDKVAVEVAQESLYTMQQSVYKLMEAVSTVTASYQRTKEKYQSRQREAQVAEQRAALAYRNGDEATARLAMSRAIGIERILPQLADQVAQAEKVLQSNQDKLNRQQQRLETYKIEMQNLKDLSEVSAALTVISEINQTFNIDSARSQFEQAHAAIEGQYERINAFAELSESPDEKLSIGLDKLTLEDEISRRLKTLN
jgi:phage shock protein A